MSTFRAAPQFRGCGTGLPAASTPGYRRPTLARPRGRAGMGRSRVLSQILGALLTRRQHQSRPRRSDWLMARVLAAGRPRLSPYKSSSVGRSLGRPRGPREGRPDGVGEGSGVRCARGGGQVQGGGRRRSIDFCSPRGEAGGTRHLKVNLAV